MEMTNAMLLSSGLSDNMWGEAVLSSRFILNKVPHKKLDKTPYKLWKGYDNLTYLKVWGCLTKRTKKEFGPDFLTTFVVERQDNIDCHFACMYLIDEDPKTYQEALNFVDSIMWKEAIKSELDSLIVNQTWELVDLPKGSKPIKLRTPYEASINLKKNKGDSVFQSKYAKIIEGYCDANWVTDNGEINSTSGYMFLLGEEEAEWIKSLMGDVLLWGTSVPVSIHCDLQATIASARCNRGAVLTLGAIGILIGTTVVLYGTRSKHPRAFVMCPTAQLSEELFCMAKYISNYRQLKTPRDNSCGELELQKSASDVSIGLLIGTPDEISELIEEGSVVLDEINYLVFDELDSMFDLGFGPNIKKILTSVRHCNEKCRSIVVTSTLIKMMHEQRSSLVKSLRCGDAGEIAAMVLEIEEEEAFHLMESPDALKSKLADVVESLRPSTQET
ncbi:DEAD-box ATP-dependent RNA helicase 39-like [Cucumis melo var. makuwa]|uniref:DEAD-box ATP-dependent RNA helicase 39-like n=1 Tax=Cucumis melo var. makuwa TaxID=1194695 RepID=A0A5D3BXT9_CUCMM|nr:DEAD-box ATP-dependent RNA helicase 39-like [Cucumis melo var. makuwa]